MWTAASGITENIPVLLGFKFSEVLQDWLQVSIWGTKYLH